MRGKIKQHLLDSVSMESKKMHKKKKKAKMQDQLDEHKARLACTKNSAYKSKNDKQMIVLSQLEMSFEDIATVIIVSKTNLY